MIDRKKVIRGLKCCLPMTTKNGLADCKQCPYDRKITLEGGVTECCHELMADALALLKAQEPVTPGIGIQHNEDGSKIYFLHCRFDGTTLDEGDNYCRKCGRAVKWE